MLRSATAFPPNIYINLSVMSLIRKYFMVLETTDLLLKMPYYMLPSLAGLMAAG